MGLELYQTRHILPTAFISRLWPKQAPRSSRTLAPASPPPAVAGPWWPAPCPGLWPAPLASAASIPKPRHQAYRPGLGAQPPGTSASWPLASPSDGAAWPGHCAAAPSCASAHPPAASASSAYPVPGLVPPSPPGIGQAVGAWMEVVHSLFSQGETTMATPEHWLGFGS